MTTKTTQSTELHSFEIPQELSISEMSEKDIEEVQKNISEINIIYIDTQLLILQFAIDESNIDEIIVVADKIKSVCEGNNRLYKKRKKKC